MNHRNTRNDAISKARHFLTTDPIYLDTETTGTHDGAEIIEICLVDKDGQVLIDKLVKPQCTIAPQSTAIHGITNAMVADASSWSAIWPEVAALISGRTVGIYNADFDLRMLKQSHQVAGLPWQPLGASAVCLMKLYARYYGDWNPRHRSYRWQSLDKAGQQCGIPLPNNHRAKGDTLLARAVLLHMAEAQGS